MSEPTHSLTGRLLQGRYLVGQKLGEGGMGAVYRGEHTLMKKDIALKVLLPELSSNRGIVMRFQQEAQSASRLDHPGVVRIFDFGETDDGLLFLVMELLEGESLSDHLQRYSRLPAARAIEIAHAVAMALAHAHKAGVVHRDLKPDNLFLTRTDEGEVVKILDFGIAKITAGADGPAQGLTQAGMVFGTPHYLSPEQASGDAVDGRADLYALGVMLYEMVTGKKPFTAPSNMKLIVKQISEPPVPPTEAAPDANIPPELEGVILRALEKSPDARFPNARSFAAALEELEISETLSEGPRLPAPSLTVHPTPAERAPSSEALAPATGTDATAIEVPASSVPGVAPAGEPPPDRTKLLMIALGGGGGLLVLILVMVFALGGSKAGPSPEVNRKLDKLEKMLRRGKAGEVLTQIKQIVADHPKIARAHLIEGHACAAKQRHAECLPSFAEAVRLAPRNAGDKTLSQLLSRLLSHGRGKTASRRRAAAIKFVTTHLRLGDIDKRMARVLTEFVNKTRETEAAWQVLAVLREQSKAGDVDLPHAYELRLRTEKSCEQRMRYLDQIAGLKQRRFIPLLQKLRQKKTMRHPLGKYRVDNKCLYLRALEVIKALEAGAKESPKLKSARLPGMP